ncbi:MAG: ATP-binding cassette domain-containing protein, partial [Syntrophomonadaceae bacterium]|nr:ATP-binding cassette domain-containing protein [Syntrophomonadaceae bacterium]
MSRKNVILSLKSVSKTYDMGEVEVMALKNTSLDVYEGEFLVILGPSGSGKSTLLNIMGGMDTATAGEVNYNDLNLSLANEKTLT